MEFVCICGKKCSSAGGLNLHKKKCQGQTIETDFQCEKCNKYCASSSGLKIHSKVCGTNRVFACECGRICTSKGGLTLHKKKCDGSEPIVKSPPRSLVCEKCNKVCKNGGGLTMHRKTCENTDPPKKCDNCERTFKPIGLKIHMKKCLAVEDIPKETCEYCSGTFKNKMGLALHKKSCKYAPKNKLKTEKNKPESEVENIPDFQCSKCLLKMKTKCGINHHEKTCGIDNRIGSDSENEEPIKSPRRQSKSRKSHSSDNDRKSRKSHSSDNDLQTRKSDDDVISKSKYNSSRNHELAESKSVYDEDTDPEIKAPSLKATTKCSNDLQTRKSDDDVVSKSKYNSSRNRSFERVESKSVYDEDTDPEIKAPSLKAPALKATTKCSLDTTNLVGLYDTDEDSEKPLADIKPTEDSETQLAKAIAVNQDEDLETTDINSENELTNVVHGSEISSEEQESDEEDQECQTCMQVLLMTKSDFIDHQQKCKPKKKRVYKKKLDKP